MTVRASLIQCQLGFASAATARRARQHLPTNPVIYLFANVINGFAPLKGYDEPEILPSSTPKICLIGADAGQLAFTRNLSRHPKLTLTKRAALTPLHRGPLACYSTGSDPCLSGKKSGLEAISPR
jgi:hypothetical protein